MQKIAPASTTKLMTAYIVLNQCNLDDTVTVSHDIALEDGAVALFIGKGDTITVDELLHGLLIESANDCAVVLAEYVSGSVKEFAKLMNETAVSLGATHSHFMNPHGLDEDNHYSCAYDLYLILQKDLENEHFRDIVSKASYTVRYTDENGEKVKCPITTTNQYFKGNYEVPNGITILGGKTGTTSNAGHCLVLASTNREGQSLIGVVLNATDNNQLYDTMSHLLSENQ
jgi:D-alanyl-D-alanine carboxypeptidase (penicillin-binding protein 5/6)